jgi:hypothetical protein
VPLTVTRADYAGPISLALVGAPPGVTLTPDEIGAGVNALVCKLSAGPDAPLGLHAVQILARLATAPDAPPALVRTLPLIDRQRVNVDLIPFALREDQRRLPPALTDRLALQVTPPAPFTVELPEPAVTLARYQRAEFPVVTTRAPGFRGPIRFTARGGQLADKEEGRTRLFAEFPEASAERLEVQGAIQSRILTNLAKHRVEVTASATHAGRRVTLTRTFDLDIRTAFAVTAEPARVTAEPGGTVRVHLALDRVKTFDGDVAVQLSPSQGFTLPEKVVIPRGQAGVDLDLPVEASLPPGRRSIAFYATALVDGYEEEQRGGRFEIEIPKAAPPNK